MLYTSINEWKKHLMKNESKKEYDSNGNLIYSEDSDGFWYKKEYDSKGNGTYYEDSTGYWTKTEYDSNGKEIYYENSYGYWYKKEYDSEGNEIYFANSNGLIKDWRNINERRKRLLKNESKGKSFPIIKKDSNGNETYVEELDGSWYKCEYDSKGNRIYYENSDGFWHKSEYDSNGDRIYYENSDGQIRDNRNINERRKRLMKNESKKGVKSKRWGGKTIGVTSSGKPVYETGKKATHEVYSDFTIQDHMDAAKLHDDKAAEYQKMITPQMFKNNGKPGFAKNPVITKRDYHNQRRIEHGFEISRLKRESK